jgi:hypothetical protein
MLLLLAASSMPGCGQPTHPPPQGFVESCYGGDFKKYLNGKGPRISIRIPMTESEWPDLAESLRQFSVEQNLDFFDTTLRLDYAHVLGLSVCSPKGLQVHASDDVWKSDPKADGDPGYTTVFLYTYKNFDASAIGNALVAHLQGRHPGATVRRTDKKGAPENQRGFRHGEK